ncbi:pitrilysin family protein [Marinoscillum sp. MHG1-6]|uniref:M16 family metallopeptidase n=1 Tax=Marinoscillum sp. MHG1-6 TaxID=2959627 RepID=UPI002157D8E0|nr:insulinase family protein [Marinoscillum sp. MHG1-6]
MMKRLTFLLLSGLLAACSPEQPYQTNTVTEDGYTYQTVNSDPMNTRIYTLKNGLKVYLSDYENEPRAHFYLAVKAGGKNDPADNTGLAHYLEHLMFKGNDEFGTLDYETEKVYLDSIEAMFNYYGTLEDSAERKAYYQLIDQVSNEAAKYAIPNEYDKMTSAIGAKGLNAYTAKDRTVYTIDIPSNEIGRFLELEGSRFRKIVPRLFHTELEAVYEEKNRALDSDDRKMYETTLQALFKKHTYGTQKNIGTIEHLKNPSITAIKAYFDTYYKPNNVAICISGDIEYSETIKLIDQYFGDWEPNENLKPWLSPEEDPITEPIIDTVWGPKAEMLYLSYRFKGEGSKENRYVKMIDMILSNSTAGLIDLNLNQQQKVLGAGCSPWVMNDYTVHNFSGRPKPGQTLIEVRDLLLEQIELVKKGEFEDWLMPAVIADFKKSSMKSLENNRSRAGEMVTAFTNDIDWATYLSEIDELEKITKEEIVAFANEHYNDNYSVVYKLTGEDPNKQKVEKPSITKVPLNRDQKSNFQEMLLSKEVEKLQPVYVNYADDVEQFHMKGINVLSKKNEENELFSLTYLLDRGRNESPKLETAVQYLEYAGTSTMSAEDFQKELYKLGCSFNVSASEERTYVTLSGLDEYMEKATTLFEDLLANPASNQEALDKLVDRKLQARENSMKDKGSILWSGLFNYAKYGPDSPFRNSLNNSELKDLKAEEMAEIIKTIPKMPHRVLYYGPRDTEKLKSFLDAYHPVPKDFLPLPEKVSFEELSTDDEKVFWTDYDMVQSEILFVHRAGLYNPELEPEVHLFNEYFGGSMNSIVFQEIRESQGLAYAVFAGYSQPMDKEKSEYLFSYIGTQSDKQSEAMTAMMELLTSFPESQTAFQIAKEGILNQIESERVTRGGVIWNYIRAQDAGIDHDIRKDIYDGVKNMTFEDLRSFHEAHIKGKTFTTALIGSRDNIDFKSLEAYGPVKELSLNELFGYE